MVEAAIAMTLLLTLTLGFVDFGYALYQWNAANKAVQVGARAASISNPVVAALASAAGTADTALVGTAMPADSYSYSCTGAGVCCTGAGVCTSTLDQPSFDAIYNRMIVFFPRLQPANVRITYSATGLGYWGRPGGPVPTVTVSLEGLTFQFFFLQGLMSFTNITMPSMLSTVTGEDMKSTWP
ncbi:TadE/TadG family type IV pilus assembly protein [Mesorhizobium sp. M0496]|uniref:TadE/TadG family type IV pilus assembly protein n=1 Tax=Mesorhizobium sp. M0496 TaxID=2956952 RepID=UPI00333D4C93